MTLFLIFIYTLFLGFSSCSLVTSNDQSTREVIRSLADSSPCPLNFGVLRGLLLRANRTKRDDPFTDCTEMLQALRPVQSDYLKRTGFFLPPSNSSESCWDSYQTLVNEYIPKFDMRSECGFRTNWISEGCMNITTRSQFEGVVPQSSLQDVQSSCSQSLDNNSPCASCTTSLSRLQASYLNGEQVGNVTECAVYPFIYAAAVVNQFGPSGFGTMKCLFSIDSSSSSSSGSGSSHSKKRKIALLVALITCSTGLGVIGGVLWFLWRRRHKKKKRVHKKIAKMSSFAGLDSIGASTNLIRYTVEEIKRATKNFSRDNIIGKGGYGNVYKGVLPDGTEVALKRFKNCSAAGQESFTHEVQVIASVRHVNLVALRGYCTASTPYEGYQRIIVCDLMSNGSLHDHLFDSTEKKLSWPTRRNIALGTARGLAYLHYGAQPAIIHRDIKASNILLDENFEAKVADFGLAKFTPEGVTHLSTRVAGTLGYVSPEYALFGQLTERSDVYSYGVLLLEILSGKKAIISNTETYQNTLVTDWAWSLVKKGRSLDVIEEGMTELDSPEVMDKYVLLAVLCSHPQLHARPPMDQIVKILETDLPVPSIPERPIPVISEIHDIEKSVSGSDSGYPSGYHQLLFENCNPATGSDFRGNENSFSTTARTGR